jgi:hypothetical protein
LVNLMIYKGRVDTPFIVYILNLLTHRRLNEIQHRNGDVTENACCKRVQVAYLTSSTFPFPTNSM